MNEHPAVQEAAVVGSPDDIRGLIVKAFVILKPGFKPSEGLVREIQNHVKKVTASYIYLRAIEFFESLPRTVSGKNKRNKLRDREMKRSLNGSHAKSGERTPYLYVISYIIYTGARVAKPGQRRQVQGLISQEFLGSNPIPRIGLRCSGIIKNFELLLLRNNRNLLLISGKNEEDYP
jgi:hypothetical protein